MTGGAAKLCFSILFILLLPEDSKLDGVISASIIGYILIQIPWESHVMFTAYFERKQAGFAVIALLLCFTVWSATDRIPLHGFKGLVVKGAVAALFSGACVFALFGRDRRSMFRKMLGRS